ncbi:MAG: hypothetical protein AAF939_22120, partial [Planctomycetota bacterium]
LRRFDDPIYGPSDPIIGFAKMSQFANLWRGFTRTYLNDLLTIEYPNSNLVYQIRRETFQESDQQTYLEDDFMYIGVAYWAQMDENMPGLFTNPLDSDSVGFAQAQMFIPRRRIMEDLTRLPPDYDHPFIRFGGPQHRDLMNQNWSIKLVPATAEAILGIAQTDPPNLPFSTPNLRGIGVEDFQQLNSH